MRATGVLRASAEFPEERVVRAAQFNVEANLLVPEVPLKISLNYNVFSMDGSRQGSESTYSGDDVDRLYWATAGRLSAHHSANSEMLGSKLRDIAKSDQ